MKFSCLIVNNSTQSINNISNSGGGKWNQILDDPVWVDIKEQMKIRKNSYFDMDDHVEIIHRKSRELSLVYKSFSFLCVALPGLLHASQSMYHLRTVFSEYLVFIVAIVRDKPFLKAFRNGVISQQFFPQC